ncbi:MAG TPA: ATP-binding protein [Kineosporiaceae bacterium]|nr:ATP-binding protein [Kineosporiaceae bacterium]
MEITVEHYGERPVVDVAGRLDAAAAGPLRTALLEAAAEQPEAVLCDLTGASADPLALPVFLTVADELQAWPSCSLVLVVPDGGLRGALERLGVGRRVVIARSRRDAAQALSPRPSAVRAALGLAPTRTAPAQARSFLRTCLARWSRGNGTDVDGDAAALVLDELVTNAVLHSRTPVEVLVGLRGHALRIAVADRSPVSPRHRAAGDEEENGRGLALVEALAGRWGVLPRPAEGKIVWAVLPGKGPLPEGPR